MPLDGLVMSIDNSAVFEFSGESDPIFYEAYLYSGKVLKPI